MIKSGSDEEKDGRHEETRTPDLYRVSFKVSHLKPSSLLAFPAFQRVKKLEQRSFCEPRLVV